MNEKYREIEKIIENARVELKHLDEEVKQLNDDRGSMFSSDYNKELSAINRNRDYQNEKIRDYEQVINEMKHLDFELKQLEEAKSSMFSSDYNRELEVIKRHQIRQEEKLNELNNKYNIKLVNDEIGEIKDEISKLEEEKSESIKDFTNILEEEKKDIIENAPYKTDDEIISVINDYGNKIYMQNNRLRLIELKIEELKEKLLSSTEQNSMVEKEEEKTDNVPPVIPIEEDENVKQLPALSEDKVLALPAPKKFDGVKQLPGPVINKQLPVVVENESKKPRGLLTIIEGITDGVELKKKDGKRYRASNIKVAKSFINELNSGNYLYNIVHFVPNIIRTPFKLLSKLANKIVYTKKSKQRIETIKERISNLSDEDMMTIYKEYRSGKIIAEKFPSALNIALEEKMKSFVLQKVDKINENLENKYIDVFSTAAEVKRINEMLKSNISSEEKEKLENYKKSLLEGRSEEIKEIRNNYIEANNWLSGGLHGFSEDLRAAATKLSYVGKRFTKEHDLDLDLLHKEAELERNEIDAINRNDDERALNAFIERETLLSSNTEIEKSIFGRRSSGKKYYSPLAFDLDYGNDPFIRDIFTTIAVTGAAVSAVNAISTDNKVHSALDDNKVEVERINSNNDKTIYDVNQMGEDIVNKRNTMISGMKAQNHSDVLSSAEQLERRALDKSAETYGGWAINTPEYHKFDSQGHNIYNGLYENTKNSLKEVTQKYGNGEISQQQAVNMVYDITSNTHNSFIDITQKCLNTLTKYAKDHKNFDLTGIKKSMEYLVKHPNAITKMNKAMIETTNIGDRLKDVELEQLSALTDLPSDIRTTIFGAASSTLLALNVSNTVTKKYGYGNNVTHMVNEYIASSENEETKQK